MSSRKKRKKPTSSRSSSNTFGLVDWRAECLHLAKFLLRKKESVAFREPVDWEALHLPDYPEVIKEPMDLGTIQEKLLEYEYENCDEFAEDVRLVWSNAQTYNPEGSGIYLVSKKLSDLFEKRFEKLKDILPEKREATSEEQEMFKDYLKKLPKERLEGIIELIEKFCEVAITRGEDKWQLCVDIDKIDGETLVAANRLAEQLETREEERQQEEEEEEGEEKKEIAANSKQKRKRKGSKYEEEEEFEEEFEEEIDEFFDEMDADDEAYEEEISTKKSKKKLKGTKLKARKRKPASKKKSKRKR